MRRSFALFLLATFLLILIFGISSRLPFSAQAQGDCLPPRLAVGEQGQVTPGSPNRLRDTPNTGGALVGEIPGGETFDVVDGPTCSDGIQWWQVTYNGTTGWTAESANGSYFVEPVSAALSTATAVATSAATTSASSVVCAGSPPPRLIVGQFARVLPPNPLRLRETPGTAGVEIRQIQPNQEFVVVSGPVCVNDLSWYEVEDAGVTGYIAEGVGEDYLTEPIAATPMPPATRTSLPTVYLSPTPSRTSRPPTATLTPTLTPSPTPVLFTLDRPYNLSWSADGETIAVSTRNNVVLIRDFFSDDPAYTTVAIDGVEAIWSVEYLPGSSTQAVVASYGEGGKLSLVDLDTGEELDRLESPTQDRAYIRDYSFSGDGTRLAVSVYDEERSCEETLSVMLFSVEAGTLDPIETFDFGGDHIALNSDGTQLVADVRTCFIPDPVLGVQPGDFDADSAYPLFLYNLDAEGEPIQLDRGNVNTIVRDLAFAPDDTRVALSDNWGNVQSWNVETGDRASLIRSEYDELGRLTMEGGLYAFEYSNTLQVFALQYTPDGRTLAVVEGYPSDASFDPTLRDEVGVVRLLSTVGLQPLGSYGLAPNDPNTSFLDVAYSPDGEYYAYLSNDGVGIVQASDNTLVARLDVQSINLPFRFSELD